MWPADALKEWHDFPRWAADYFMHEKFELPQLTDYVKEGSSISVSVGDYFSTMLDQSMNWQGAADVRKKWGKQFCLKGIMSIADAKRAVDIGATAIMVSNHGGRQLDGSRSPFDQLAEIVDAVGDRVDVVCDGGITRGTHVLKALSVGAKACGDEVGIEVARIAGHFAPEPRRCLDGFGFGGDFHLSDDEPFVVAVEDIDFPGPAAESLASPQGGCWGQLDPGWNLQLEGEANFSLSWGT